MGPDRPLAKNVVDAMLSNISEGGKADAGNSCSQASMKKRVQVEVLKGDLINKFKRSSKYSSKKASS